MPSVQTISSGGADFYVAARESGHSQFDLPLWAAKRVGAVAFTAPSAAVERVDLPAIPGAFQLLNLLNEIECDRFVEIAEALGFTGDAPVSLPRRVRHNDNFNWVVDESIDAAMWARCAQFFDGTSFDGAAALGLNARFRFYRYGEGDFFDPHTDGAWPGSRVIDGQLVADAYGDRMSQMTFLVFLSDGYEGGRTLFQTAPGTFAAVATPKGAALCFPHGFHPQHCVHAGEEVRFGFKYIIRTDVLYG